MLEETHFIGVGPFLKAKSCESWKVSGAFSFSSYFSLDFSYVLQNLSEYLTEIKSLKIRTISCGD